MRVVFLEDVQGVARGGEVKTVKDGFARNYLIPHKLAIPATKEALKRVERLKKQAEANRLKRLEDIRSLAQGLEGVQVKIEARAGADGRLYGSVTNAVVATQLSAMTGRPIDRRAVELGDHIRQVGIYPAKVRLNPELEATVSLIVYAPGTDPAALLAKPEEAPPAADTSAATPEQTPPAADTSAATPEQTPAQSPEAEAPSDTVLPSEKP